MTRMIYESTANSFATYDRGDLSMYEIKESTNGRERDCQDRSRIEVSVRAK